MGEARYRKQHDPMYGRAPKGGRGLVISPPVYVEGRNFSMTGGFDPQELRFSLLFWDRLAWPVNPLIHLASSPDIQFLEEAGVLTRPAIPRPSYTVDGAQFYANSHIQSFIDLDEREPGCWAMAQGQNSFDFRGSERFDSGRTLIFQLTKGIPVPCAEIPLNDILEFKQKRADELVALRSEIDGAYKSVIAAGDFGHEYRCQIERIDRACADAVRTSKEWGFPIKIADMDVSFELDLGRQALNGVLAGAASAISMEGLHNLGTHGPM